jgi:hypothetical protein
MTLTRRIRRDRRDNPENPQSEYGLSPDELANRLNPFRRIFPWDFPGQIGDWLRKPRK